MRSANPLEAAGPPAPASDSGDCCCCCTDYHGERDPPTPFLSTSRPDPIVSSDWRPVATSRAFRLPDGYRAHLPEARSWHHFSSRPASLQSPASSMRRVVLLGLFTQASLAAFVRYENCLQDSYKNYDPKPLQWIPNRVDAVFDTMDPRHTLRVTMWGNVTGAFTNVTLPPPGSPDWADPTKLDGKILDEPDLHAPSPKITTLHSKVEMLTYQPWSNSTNFCKSVAKAANASCPLGPVFNVNERWVGSVMCYIRYLCADYVRI